MIDPEYSFIIEATDDPDFFGLYSEELEGFTGVGHSIEDCVYKAQRGMQEHVSFLKETGRSIPSRNPDPTVVIHNQRQTHAVKG